MIYADDNTTLLVIPRHYDGADNFTLRLTNAVTREVVTFPDLANVSTTLFAFAFSVEMQDKLVTGEYKYEIIDADGYVVETGLLRYGNFENEADKELTHIYNND